MIVRHSQAEIEAWMQAEWRQIRQDAATAYVNTLKEGLPDKAARNMRVDIDSNGNITGDVGFGLTHENLSRALTEMNRIISVELDKLPERLVEKFPLELE